MAEAPESAITLTEIAATKIAEMIGDSPEGEKQALRVAVRGGGCSGFQYSLAFDTKSEDDLEFEHRGVSVIVDKVSMQFVFGSEVDYVDGLTGAGFQVNNPNVVAACGCGSSFQVKDDAEPPSPDPARTSDPARTAEVRRTAVSPGSSRV